MQLRGSKLLVVDDDLINTSLLVSVFRRQGCDVMALNESTGVLDAVATYEPDLIILDVMMPDQSGYDLTRQIKSQEAFKHIPVVLLTALDDQQSRLLGLESGAEDFITKPFNRRELLARAANLLKLKKLNDFLKQNLRLMQEYDPVTGLPSKKLLRELAESMFLKQEQSRVNFALCEIEIRRSVIHSISHGKQDFDETQLHRSVVERMSKSLPPQVLIGSLGEGRFGILMDAGRQDALQHLRGLAQALARPFIFNNQELYLPFAIGYVSHEHIQPRWKLLLHQAELALTEAKRNRGDVIREFVPEMDAAHYEEWWLSQALFAAVRTSQFELYYQPQIDLLTNRLIGFEALTRWPHAEKGFISPSEFIPMAENNGAIHDLSLWVFEEACKQAAAWRRMGHNIMLAINLSAVQLYRKNLALDLKNLVDAYQLPCSCFELELTETSLADQKCEAQLRELWEQGFQISIDDFGTGYSNLAYLNRYPFHRLKIDRSFIHNICQSEKDVAIIRAILAIADNLDFRVIAEGVETPEQLRKIEELGCHEVQGFLFGQPAPATQATRLLKHPEPA